VEYCAPPRHVTQNVTTSRNSTVVRFDNNTLTGSKIGVDEEETSLYDALSDHPSEEESTNSTSFGSDPDPAFTNSGVNADEDGDNPNSTSNSGVGREDDDDLPPGLDYLFNSLIYYVIYMNVYLLI
jgi:hypothetical protein